MEISDAPGAPHPSDAAIPEQCDEDMDEQQDDQMDAEMGFIGLLAPSFDDEVSEFLLQQVGIGDWISTRSAEGK